MIRFAVRRLIGMITVLFAISVIVFLIFNVIPNSDPAARIAGKNANPALIARVRADLGLDQPLPMQYLTMMKQIFTGQLTSYASDQNVAQHIWSGLPVTLSLCIGGVIERSEVMHLMPQEFSSIWIAMTFLMVTKVLLGMVMDPFGAVILVSSTLAPIAYNAGIDPVHFWMMVLVAFELGYLLPPVALNQLLTRLVVGEKEMDLADAEVAHEPFFRHYERWIVPVVVMTIGMLIVAYGPLIVSGK